MKKFLMLFSFTDKGRENIQKSPERMRALETFPGGRVIISLFSPSTPGFDTLFVVEAESQEDVTRLALKIEQAGNVVAKIYPLFTVEQFADIVATL